MPPSSTPVPAPAPTPSADASDGAVPVPTAGDDVDGGRVPPPAGGVDKPCDPKSGWALADEVTFTMSVPCDLERKDAQGIDSQIGKFESNTLRLTYDYGMYSNPLTSTPGPNAKVSHETIGGLSATLVTAGTPGGGAFPLSAGVHIPRAGKRRGISLTVWVECANLEARATAHKIFRSIRFVER